MSQADLVTRAKDPDTPLETLQQLAQNYPGLRPHVASNPSAYPALLEWLGNLGDPAIDAALEARNSGATAGTESTSFIPPVRTSTGASASSASTSVMPAQYLESDTGTVSSIEAFATDEPEDEVLPKLPTRKKNKDNTSNTPLWIVIAVLAILLSLLLGWAIGTIIGSSTDPITSTASNPTSAQEAATTDDAAADDAATTAEETPSPTPSPTASATPELTAPAPDGAEELSAFTSPSGNITCTLSEDSVSCSIKEYSFDADGSKCSSSSKPYTSTVGTEGDASGTCATAFSASGAVLSYGSSAKNDTFACTSAEDGVSCWNQVNGEGFTINRSGATSKTF